MMILQYSYQERGIDAVGDDRKRDTNSDVKEKVAMVYLCCFTLNQEMIMGLRIGYKDPYNRSQNRLQRSL
jgi:hypothetical protein